MWVWEEGGWNFKKTAGGKGRDPGENGRWELGEKVLGNGGMREVLGVRTGGKRDGVRTGGMKEGGGNWEDKRLGMRKGGEN